MREKGSGLLPTVLTRNKTSQRAKTGRVTSGPSRGGPSYGLEDILEQPLSATTAEWMMGYEIGWTE